MSRRLRRALILLLVPTVMALVPGCNHKPVRDPEPDQPTLPMRVKWPVEPPDSP